LFGEEKCELGRNFATKIWNASRLVFMQREKHFEGPADFARYYAGFDPSLESFDMAGRWILSSYNAMLERYHAAFAQFRMNDIVKTVYEFFWGDYCDWYLEALKVTLAEGCSPGEARKAVALAVHVLEGSLRVLHPVMPFNTDEIWHSVLPRPAAESIASSEMPVPAAARVAEEGFGLVQKVVTEIRSLKALFGVPPGLRAEVRFKGSRSVAGESLNSGLAFIAALGQCTPSIIEDDARPPHAAASVVEGHELFVLLEGLISFEKERSRLEKEIQNVSGYVTQLKKKLSNSGFADHAPEDVVAKEREKLADAEANLLKLEGNLAVLSD
jgi:valyl-tRNA synthetase